MVLDHRQHYLAPARSALSTLVAPLQYAINAPIKLTENISTSLTTRQRLLAENSALRAQQLFLQAKLQKLIALEDENRQLRALLQSSLKTQNEQITVAQLLAVNTDPLTSELIIDKGTKSGVYEGQPVLDASGIMGQIIQTAPLTSRIMLITDLRSAVPVQDTHTGVRGLVVGQGSLEKLKLTDIPETVTLHVGDLLETSGLGGHYPAGYPVGVITAIHYKSGEQFTSIDVVPSAQIDRSQNVLLIWPQHVAVDLPSTIIKSDAKPKKEKGKKA